MSEWLSSANQQTTRACEDVDKGEFLYTAENSTEFPQKIKTGTVWSNSSSGYISKENQYSY